MKTVTFGVYWQCYGYQTIELPDYIDVNDKEAVKAHLQKIWDFIPLPEGEYVPESDALDPEFIHAREHYSIT